MNLFDRPGDFHETTAEVWFASIADHLLNRSLLQAGGELLRPVEVECYYHGPRHRDPFAHRDPVQLETGRWYFHRTGGKYRNGSFKGLDLSFGGNVAHAGVLLRGLEKPDGTLIDGPSLCVDYLLKLTQEPTVAELDRRIAGRLAWEAGNPLQLIVKDRLEVRQVYRSARVGLSLKKASSLPTMPSFLLRKYRYLTQPRKTAKGKALLVMSLVLEGKTIDEIRALTGCTKAAVDRYLKEFEAGKADVDFTPYIGTELNSARLCRLHGIKRAND